MVCIQSQKPFTFVYFQWNHNNRKPNETAPKKWKQTKLHPSTNLFRCTFCVSSMIFYCVPLHNGFYIHPKLLQCHQIATLEWYQNGPEPRQLRVGSGQKSNDILVFARNTHESASEVLGILLSSKLETQTNKWMNDLLCMNLYGWIKCLACHSSINWRRSPLHSL